jgi:hypothetical protein
MTSLSNSPCASFSVSGLLQRRPLAFGQNQAFLGDLGFQRLQSFLPRLKIVTLPNAADAGW